MSCTQSIAAAPHVCRHRPPSVKAQPRLRHAAIDHLWHRIALWAERRRQRHDLAELDEHLLRDIGVTRAEAAREVAKAFWVD